MAESDLTPELRDHQNRALDVLRRGAACVEAGPDAVAASLVPLRAEMADALQRYQVFKHERIFDPAVASGNKTRSDLARAMKVECVAAGETFRAHQKRWRDSDVAADWATYKPAVRLTINQLRRHITRERDGIDALIALPH